MAANWRRCQKCRKVLPVEDFDGDSEICRTDTAKAATAATAPARAGVTTKVTTTKPRVPATAVRDIRGHGDVEVRARRARSRALERLSELHAEEFADLLGEERRSEGL
jgi:ribosomal protein S12